MDEWTASTPGPGEVAVYWRQSDDGVLVEVAVRELGRGYVVREVSEHRCSGPNEWQSEVIEGYPDAVGLARGRMRHWDELFAEG